MPDKTIFFSYSRQDSDFALNLAKDLRLAGADIWLDQLDIQPGSHWDQSIEEALKASKILLVILSKTSVDSKTVMDEVSYALEEDKIVVPVLLERCEIPFRIRRLQYADFTGDYKTGTMALGSALELEKGIANRFVAAATVTDPSKGEKVAVETVSRTTPPVPPVPKKEQDAEKAPAVDNSTKHIKRSSIALLVLVSLVLVAIIGLGIWLVPKFMVDKEAEAWAIAIKDNTVASYERYIDDFPAGNHIEEANDKVVALGLAKQKVQEDEAWAAALKQNDAIMYNIYLRDFPEGAHVADARTKIEELYNEGQDEEAWNRATGKNSVAGFMEYIDNFAAKGIHHDDAVTEIKKMLVASGYAYYGEKNTDNRIKSDRFFDQVEGDKDAPPNEGDLIKVSNPGGVTIRTGPDKNNSPKGTMSFGDIAEVTKIFPAGDHFWIRLEH